MEKIEAEKPAKDVDMVEVAPDTPVPEEGGEDSTAAETDATAADSKQSLANKSAVTENKEPADSVKDEQDRTETTASADDVAEKAEADEGSKPTDEVSGDAENEKTETQVAVVVAERTTLLTVSYSESSPHCLVVPHPH